MDDNGFEGDIDVLRNGDVLVVAKQDHILLRSDLLE
jgi:hypothetical protein